MSSTIAIPASAHLEHRSDRGLGGLIALTESREQALPLRDVRVRASIAGHCARVVVEQWFHNPLDTPVHAVHIFPLPDRGAVTEVELRCGELVVRAECREREAAARAFDDARAAGHRAALLTQERDDVHTLRVANLPPGETVSVRVVVVERLEVVDGLYRWRFPTVIAPRYLPGTPIGHEGPGVVPDTDAAPDASRLQPPLRLAGGTALDLEVSVAGPVTALESSLDAVRVGLDADGVRVAPGGRRTLDRDFVLAFSTAAPDQTAARAWTDGSHTLVVVEPPSEVLPPAIPRDVVFVIDISGSMAGRKIEAAREALGAALHGLMPGDRFMLVAFDDRLEVFRPGFLQRLVGDFIAYDDRSLARADAWLMALQPRGGTEMLPAIRAALAGTTPAGRLRTVLFITDGQAANEAQLVHEVASTRRGARFFTLGIDTAVNSSLLRRMARVGGGTCELLAPHDDIDAAIARLEARIGSPLVEDVVVEGHEAASLAPQGVFHGCPAGLLVVGAPDEVVVTGRGPSGALRIPVAVRRVDWPLGALWARERIAALEDRIAVHAAQEPELRPVITELALAHGVASRYTAFVAVERSRTIDGEAVEIVQPAELPHGWAPPQAPGAPMIDAMVMAAPRASMAGGGRRRAAPSGPVARASKARMPSASAPPPPAMRSAPRPAPAPLPAEPSARLARSQSADGSFGGDVARTAAALVALVLLGHTRRAGLRKRVVLKAATWLARQRDPMAARALALLEGAESGAAIGWDASWDELRRAGAEGALLGEVADRMRRPA